MPVVRDRRIEQGSASRRNNIKKVI